MAAGIDIYRELLEKGYSKQAIHALLLKLVKAESKLREGKQTGDPKPPVS